MTYNILHSFFPAESIATKAGSDFDCKNSFSDFWKINCDYLYDATINTAEELQSLWFTYACFLYVKTQDCKYQETVEFGHIFVIVIY